MLECCSWSWGQCPQLPRGQEAPTAARTNCERKLDIVIVLKIFVFIFIKVVKKINRKAF